MVEFQVPDKLNKYITIIKVSLTVYNCQGVHGTSQVEHYVPVSLKGDVRYEGLFPAEGLTFH